MSKLTLIPATLANNLQSEMLCGTKQRLGRTTLSRHHDEDGCTLGFVVETLDKAQPTYHRESHWFDCLEKAMEFYLNYK